MADKKQTGGHLAVSLQRKGAELAEGADGDLRELCGQVLSKAREHHVADPDVGRCERELQHAERHRDKIVDPHADRAFGLEQTAAQCSAVCQAFGCRSPLEQYVAKPVESVSETRAIGPPLNDFKTFALEKLSKDRSIVAANMTHIPI